MPIEWRTDMRNAPRNGKPVLLWLREPWSRPEKARWYAPWETWITGDAPDDPDNDDYYGIGTDVPSHWAEINPPDGCAHTLRTH